jgi:predicted RNA binding protein YcfA (HicA-like mRNA interferase family)
MTPTNYESGVVGERKCVHELRDLGYTAIRTAGSHGTFDVIAWDRSNLVMVQCKRTKNPRSPSRQEVASIRSCAVPPHTLTEIWIYTKGVGKPRKWSITPTESREI